MKWPTIKSLNNKLNKYNSCCSETPRFRCVDKNNLGQTFSVTSVFGGVLGRVLLGYSSFADAPTCSLGNDQVFLSHIIRFVAAYLRHSGEERTSYRILFFPFLNLKYNDTHISHRKDFGSIVWVTRQFSGTISAHCIFVTIKLSQSFTLQRAIENRTATINSY